jgi:hypothetical protein
MRVRAGRICDVERKYARKGMKQIVQKARSSGKFAQVDELLFIKGPELKKSSGVST